MIERLHRWLLRLYPRPFREEFGEEMLATARELDRQHPGGRRRLRAIVDAVSTAWSVRRELRDEQRLTRPTKGWPLVQTLTRDLTAAWRRLRREPLFALFVIATLGVAVGANAALFGIADRLILSGPEQIVRPDRVKRVTMSVQPPGMDVFTTSTVGHVTYELIRTRASTVDGAAAYTVNPGTIGRGAAAGKARLGYASPQFFPLLGVQPAAGRFFSDDATPTGIVISHATWQQRFGGLTLGQPLVVDDETYVVIGVAPRGFTGAELGRVDAWLPMEVLSRRVTRDWRYTWEAQWMQVVVRLRDGITREQAAADLTAAHRSAYTGDDAAAREARLDVAPLLANDAGEAPTEARVVRWLSGVSIAIFLIACANVMSLMLARSARRVREVGVQLALGASRAAIVRSQLVESVALALGGALSGLALASLLGSVVRRSLLAQVEWTASPVNLRTVVVAGAIAGAAALMVGLLPALGVSRTSPVQALRQGVREGGRRRGRLRAALTVVQAALSVVLLIGAGLFVRSLWNARTIDLGIDADHVLVVDVDRPALGRLAEGPEREAERTRRRFFHLGVLENVRRLPGVERAAVAVGLPFGNRFSRRVRVAGLEGTPTINGTGPGVSAVSDDYFATVGTAVLAGRAFTTADRAGSAPVAIVNELMAARVWPGQSALGKCVRIADGPCATIVGIAGNTHRSRLREDPFMHIYLPHGQEEGFGGAVLLVRGGPDPLAHVPALRRLLADVDPTITFVDAGTIQERVDPQLESWRLGSAVFVFSGVLALVVAGVGLYSVVAYLVANRRHEIGVRVALGARAGHVAGLVFRHSLALALAGVAIGLLLAAWAGTLVEPLLFDVAARDPLVFAGVSATLLAVAALASLVPAMRANRIDPVEALRAE